MTNERIHIGVLFGGRSGEHEVSLMSARSILSVLSTERYIVHQIGITREGQWVTGEAVLEAFTLGHTAGLTPAAILPEPGDPRLYALRMGQTGMVLEPVARLDVLFPVLHGTFGEDGTLQGLLEMADLAYVGSGVLGSAVGMDKALFKDLMRAHGLPVLPAGLLNRSQVETDLEAALNAAETVGAYPLFVKPANMGSSVGITKCRSRSDLLEGLQEAARFDRRVLVERGLSKPREIEVSVLGNDQPVASVPGEVVPDDDFYTYRAKYFDDRSQLRIPAPLPAEVTRRLQELAVAAFRAADCAGMARVDFLASQDLSEIYISEINTIPGFTRISMYPKLWEASGLPYPALIDRLTDLALQRKADRDHTERQYGSTQ